MSCEFTEPEKPFLSVVTCQKWIPLAELRGVSEVARSPRGFMTAYLKAGRKSELTCAWRKKRNGFCLRHHAEIEQLHGGKLWEETGKWAGLPTRQALALVMWAWHPNPEALARSYQLLQRLLKTGSVSAPVPLCSVPRWMVPLRPSSVHPPRSLVGWAKEVRTDATAQFQGSAT